MSDPRVTRSIAAVTDEITSLSVRERLIFAQAVFEYGTSEWEEIASVLSGHPYISRPKNFFTVLVRLAMKSPLDIFLQLTLVLCAHSHVR